MSAHAISTSISYSETKCPVLVAVSPNTAGAEDIETGAESLCGFQWAREEGENSVQKFT